MRNDQSTPVPDHFGTDPIEGRRSESLRELEERAVVGWAPARAGEPAYDRLGVRWYVIAPDGSLGRLGENHTITEHDDGTITVEPSLVMHRGWHGWLRRGVFTSV